MTDEPFSEIQKQQALDAKIAFKQGDYETCLTLMKKLISTRPNDFKVLLNKTIVDYIHKTKYKKSDEFENELEKIAAHMNLPLNNVKPNEIGLEMPNEISTTEASLKYNYALLYFHQRHFSQTEVILANLMNIFSLNHDDFAEKTYFFTYLKNLNIAPTCNAKLNRKIIFLYMDTLLLLNRQLVVFHLCNLLLDFDPGIKSLDSLCNRNAFRGTFEDIRIHVRLFRVRAALLLGHFESVEIELNSIIILYTNCYENISDSSDQEQKQLFEGINWNTLQFFLAQLQYYKDCHELSLKILSEIALSGEGSYLEPTLVWNNMALIHLRSHKYQLAGMQLQRCTKELDKFVASVVPAHLNTQGNVKNSDNPNMPVVYCQKQSSNLLQHVPIKAFSVCNHYHILYNMALQLLFSNRPAQAFIAFLKLVEVYPKNPRIWYRLAECCIKVQNPDYLADWKLETRNKCIYENPIGDSTYRKIIIDPNCYSENSNKPGSKTASQTAPTIEFASSCLSNALALFQEYLDPLICDELLMETNSTKYQKIVLSWASKTIILCNPSNIFLTGEALLSNWCSTLLLASFTALSLKSYHEAWEYARILLIQSYSPEENNVFLDQLLCEPPVQAPLVMFLGTVAPPAHKFFAKMYAAEAQMLMGNPAKGFDCLNVTFKPVVGSPQTQSQLDETNMGHSSTLFVNMYANESFSIQRPLTNQKIRPISFNLYWHKSHFSFPVNDSQAQAMLLLNAAACLGLDGKLNKAAQLLRMTGTGLLAGPQNSHPTSLILTNLFVELARGQIQSAIKSLRSTHGHVVWKNRLFSADVQHPTENLQNQSSG